MMPRVSHPLSSFLCGRDRVGTELQGHSVPCSLGGTAASDSRSPIRAELGSLIQRDPFSRVRVRDLEELISSPCPALLLIKRKTCSP